MSIEGAIATSGNIRNWDVVALRSLLSQSTVDNRPDLPLLGVSLSGVTRRTADDGRPAASENLARYKKVTPGNIIMNRLGKPHGSVGESSWSGITSPAYWVMATNPERVAPRFLHHLLRSQHMIAEYERIGKNQPPNQFDISWESFRSIEVPLPPLKEQRRIADFLDTETGKIDDLIFKKHRLVSLMNERINCRVLNHVGSSRLVKPAGGPLLPIRRALTKVARPPVASMGIITAFRDGQVTDRSLRRTEGYTLPASTVPHGQYVQTGDVVIHGLDGFAGSIGTSEANGNCSPVYHVCTPSNQGDSLFLGRLLQVLALQGYLGGFATSTRERAVDFRNWELFGGIPIPVVPVSEQHEIGEMVAILRPLRESIERSRKLALERRQALITAAVTGQFDVATANGRYVTG